MGNRGIVSPLNASANDLTNHNSRVAVVKLLRVQPSPLKQFAQNLIVGSGVPRIGQATSHCLPRLCPRQWAIFRSGVNNSFSLSLPKSSVFSVHLASPVRVSFLISAYILYGSAYIETRGLCKIFPISCTHAAAAGSGGRRGTEEAACPGVDFLLRERTRIF